VTSCKVARVRPLPSSTAHLHARSRFERPPYKRFEVSGLTHPDQATHCAFCITRGRVDEKARHWRLRIRGHVEAFSQGDGAVAAFECQPVHQHMRKGVEQNKPGRNRFCRLMPLVLLRSVLCI
jgi:hypothetical protein